MSTTSRRAPHQLADPPQPLTLAQLKAKAVRWLAAREYSRLELSRKLAAYARSSDDVAVVLEQLELQGWQSDQRVAQSIGRVKAIKQGNALIAQAMRQKGLSQELIASTLDSLPESELDRAKRVWHKKFGKSGPGLDAKERARQARFLASRGFGADVIRRIVAGGIIDDD